MFFKPLKKKYPTRWSEIWVPYWCHGLSLTGNGGSEGNDPDSDEEVPELPVSTRNIPKQGLHPQKNNVWLEGHQK